MTAMTIGAAAVDVLGDVVGSKAGGSARPGQQVMCAAVEHAMETEEHLLVEAPTGTGKSLAYAVPAALAALRMKARDPFANDDDHRNRVVISTATKALQEQLVDLDLPVVAKEFEARGMPFAFTILKGRSNYLCLSRLGGIDNPTGGLFSAADSDMEEVFEWAEDTETGDRSELSTVSEETWTKVSISSGECPGASLCDFGDVCFAEKAKVRAVESDVIVVNTHLYAAHLASGRHVLPPHAVVVVDEAHECENVLVSALSRTVNSGRLHSIAGRVRGAGVASSVAEDFRKVAQAFETTCSTLTGERVDPNVGDLALVLHSIADTAGAAISALAKIDPEPGPAKTHHAQASMVVRALEDDLSHIFEHAGELGYASWVEGTEERPRFCFARIDIAPVLASELYPHVTVVATSATLAIGGRFDILARRLGLTMRGPGLYEGDEGVAPAYDTLCVDTPFDYAKQGILYVARHLPDPSKQRAEFEPAARAELAKLAEAAGGRTLALFTSWAAARAAAEYLRENTDLAVQCQGEASRAALVENFSTTPKSVLCATQSFWTGLDLHGDQCTLVVIDRIPFGRPNDPVLQARIDLAQARGGNGFRDVQLPASAVTLAQGVGRLIRGVDDRGVVAVLDRRLDTAQYKGLLLSTMPPLWRTTNSATVVASLRRLDEAALAKA